MNSSLMAVKIISRDSHAPIVQEVLTKYGCNITTRVGFHETSADHCSNDGYIIMQLCGNEQERKGLHEELNTLDGVTAKFIEL